MKGFCEKCGCKTITMCFDFDLADQEFCLGCMRRRLEALEGALQTPLDAPPGATVVGFVPPTPKEIVEMVELYRAIWKGVVDGLKEMALNGSQPPERLKVFRQFYEEQDAKEQAAEHIRKELDKPWPGAGPRPPGDVKTEAMLREYFGPRVEETDGQRLKRSYDESLAALDRALETGESNDLLPSSDTLLALPPEVRRHFALGAPTCPDGSVVVAWRKEPGPGGRVIVTDINDDLCDPDRGSER